MSVSLDRLPDNMLSEIAQNLNIEDIKVSRLLCKKMQGVIDQHILCILEVFKNGKQFHSCKNYSTIKQIIHDYNNGISTPTLTYYNIIKAYGNIFNNENGLPLFKQLTDTPLAKQSIFNDLSQRLADWNLESIWGKIVKVLKKTNSQIQIPEDEGQNAESIRIFLNAHKEDCQRVTKLGLCWRGRLGLTEVPQEIFTFFTGLQKLDLSDNKLTTIPPQLGNLAALQKLDLSDNQLTTIPPEIGNLTALHVLQLNRNQLKTIPLEIGNFIALQHLRLGYNQLTTIPPQIGNLAALRALFLNDNKLPHIPREIGNLAALRVLELRNNMLTSIPFEVEVLAITSGLNIRCDHFWLKRIINGVVQRLKGVN